ncbi:MAG: TrkA C-terminal domain-containing protein, partial [Bacteroidales bacterium]|nr:TrkA C-terminal domain-containing protein [Bacteroidales bacterium]
LNFGRRFGVHVVSVARGSQRLNIPAGDTAILPGDRLQVIGTDQQLNDFAHELEVQSSQSKAIEPTTNEMRLKRLVIEPNSRFVGLTIQKSGIRNEYRCLIVGLEEDESNALQTPDPQRPFNAGDIIWVVGEDADMADLEKASHAQYPNE